MERRLRVEVFMTAPYIAHSIDAGWSSPVARQAHNLKSNPTPATNVTFQKPAII